MVARLNLISSHVFCSQNYTTSLWPVRIEYTPSLIISIRLLVGANMCWCAVKKLLSLTHAVGACDRMADSARGRRATANMTTDTACDGAFGSWLTARCGHKLGVRHVVAPLDGDSANARPTVTVAGRAGGHLPWRCLSAPWPRCRELPRRIYEQQVDLSPAQLMRRVAWRGSVFCVTRRSPDQVGDSILQSRQSDDLRPVGRVNCRRTAKSSLRGRVYVDLWTVRVSVAADGENVAAVWQSATDETVAAHAPDGDHVRRYVSSKQQHGTCPLIHPN